MVCAPPMEGGAVLYGISSGNGLPSILERLRSGPLAHFKPFSGPWEPLWSRSTGAFQLPMMAPAAPYTPSAVSYPRGFVVLLPEAGNPQTAPQVTLTELMYI